MKDNKRKYRIFAFTPIVLFFMVILSIGLFGLFLYDMVTNENFNEHPRIFYILLIMLVILPLSLFIWSFITMWPCISFDEKGITKTFMGKKIKYIDWNEVVEIKGITPNNGFTNWIFISKVPLNNYSLTKCLLRKDNVYIVATEEVISIICKFVPEHVLINI